jgi:hypothetical protein
MADRKILCQISRGRTATIDGGTTIFEISCRMRSRPGENGPLIALDAVGAQLRASYDDDGSAMTWSVSVSG